MATSKTNFGIFMDSSSPLKIALSLTLPRPIQYMKYVRLKEALESGMGDVIKIRPKRTDETRNKIK